MAKWPSISINNEIAVYSQQGFGSCSKLLAIPTSTVTTANHPGAHLRGLSTDVTPKYNSKIKKKNKERIFYNLDLKRNPN